MPTVAIPSLLRNLTNGADSITVPGATIREVINNLETRYPGMKARLCEDDRIKPGLAVYINGLLTRGSILESVGEDAEIHFLPAIGGGLGAPVKALGGNGEASIEVHVIDRDTLGD